MSLQSVGLKGSQEPRVEVVPTYFTSAGDDAVDLAAVAGLHLDPWQEHVLRHSLGEDRNGRWQAFECGLVVPRQNGKGSVLEARELAGLFLFNERLIVHTAQLFSTAMEHRQRIEKLIFESELREHLKGFRGQEDSTKVPGIKNGGTDISITLDNGNRIKFLARSGNSGRGFTGDLVVLDEAYNLSDQVMDALMSTMSARSVEGSPQIWYASSAGLVESDVLRRVRERALKPSKDDKRFYYAEWSVDDDADPDSVESWAQANPALGKRISADFVSAERKSLSDEGFKRERLGIWDKFGGTSVIPMNVWNDSWDAESDPGVELAFGVDVPYDRSSATIAAASIREDGKVHVEVIDRRPDTDWVMPRLEELRRKWRPIGIAYDAASQTSDVAAGNPRVKRKMAGLDGRAYMQACGAFFSDVMAGNIRHTAQPELTSAVDVARRSKGSSELWRWAKEDRSQDISPLVAVTLAHKALTESERKKQRKMVIYR